MPYVGCHRVTLHLSCYLVGLCLLRLLVGLFQGAWCHMGEQAGGRREAVRAMYSVTTKGEGKWIELWVGLFDMAGPVYQTLGAWRQN